MTSVPYGDPGLELVLDAHASTGESPTWSEREQALYWIDIEEPALRRFNPLTGDTCAWEMPSQIGSFALCRSGGALAALRTGLARIDLLTGAYVLLAAPPYNPRTHRFNGGKVDALGRFWIGTMFKPLQGAEGPAKGGAEPRSERAKPAHRYTDQEGLTPVASRAGIANGFAWSPDHRLMYITDTEERTVFRFDFDVERGAITGERVFAQFTPEQGKPDGAAIDVEGCYWCALNGAGRIVRLSPDGTVVSEISLPVTQPTMCAFGGPDLDTLYITSALRGLDAEGRRREPHAGGLFRCRPGVRGLAPPLFAD